MSHLTFLVTNDIHFRLGNPRARLDIYNVAIATKIQEIFALANQTGSNAIIISGDLTDTPGLGMSALAELGALLSMSPCPILTIAGQHDEWAHNPESLSRTPYGVLRRLGIIRDVATMPMWFRIGERQVRITGRHYDDSADRAQDYYEMPDASTLKAPLTTIHLAHGCVVERSPGFEMRCTPLSQVKTSASCLCLGDYHPGTGVKRLDNEAKTLTINVGALGRLTAGAADMERMVQIAMLQVDGDGDITAKVIQLVSARPGHEVLSSEHIVAAAQREERMAKFLDLLAIEGELTFLEVTQIVEDLARRENIPAEIVKEALQRIGKARENMGVA